MKKIFLILLALAGIHHRVSAQFASPAMAGFGSMHQSLYTAPATLPDYQYVVALPHMDFGIHNNFALTTCSRQMGILCDWICPNGPATTQVLFNFN